MPDDLWRPSPRAVEFGEHWRVTHNWLGKFGQDLLALRDAFKAGADAEALLAGKDAAVKALDARAAALSVEIETQGRRLADQSALFAAADAEMAVKKTTIDAEVAKYRESKMGTADLEVLQAAADTRRKVEIDMVQINADIANRTANRDALAAEVGALVERSQTLDRTIFEKSERLKKIEARMAEVGRFAMGVQGDG